MEGDSVLYYCLWDVLEFIWAQKSNINSNVEKLKTGLQLEVPKFKKITGLPS